MKRALLGALGAAGLVAGLAAGAVPVIAADHLEAPLVQADGRTDISDLYAFQSPTNAENTVLIMTVNPGAGVLSPTTFDPNAVYRFQLDRNGDAKQEGTIRVWFGDVEADGSQAVRIGGAVNARGRTGETINIPRGGQVFAGPFDDPFFFDFQAFQDQVKAAGGQRTFCDGHEADFFAGLNVSAIVVEVPTKTLSGRSFVNEIGIWADTRGDNGRIDRMGRPGIATVLIDDGSEDFYNNGRPQGDVNKFSAQVKANLLALSGLDGTGYTDDEAQAVTEVLLPDILTIDASSTDGYLNGRGLTDDVIDTSLTVVTGGLGANGTPVLTSDCVPANDVPFGSSFPYLAPAH